MARPGGDLESALSLNRNCNIVNKNEFKTNSAGLIYNSENPQIVPMNNFGNTKCPCCNMEKCICPSDCKGCSCNRISNNSIGNRRKSKFGNLYNQMGPAFEKNNNYLMGNNTVQALHGGATQYEPPRARKSGNNLTYIGSATEYRPQLIN